MSREGAPAHRRRRLREAARADALTGLDGLDRLLAALDSLRAEPAWHMHLPPDAVTVVDNGSRGPNIIDARRAAGQWLIEGLVPAGALAAIADMDDGTPTQVLAQGYDVVIYLHARGAMTTAPILVETLWRDGLAPERQPPEPFWAQRTASGFVRCDTEEAA